MQFLKPLSISAETVFEDHEKRLQRWRHAYQDYQIRLATFYGTQSQLREQVERQLEYQQELSFQREDLERYKHAVVQRQLLHGK